MENDSLNFVKSLFGEYDNPDKIKTSLGMKLLDAVNDKIKQLEINTDDIDEELIKLIKYYKKLEQENDLLYISFESWCNFSNPIKEYIIKELNPLLINGACVSCSELLRNHEYQVFHKLPQYLTCFLIKYHRYYELKVNDCRVYKKWALNMFSEKDLVRHYDYLNQHTLAIYQINTKDRSSYILYKGTDK